MILYLYIHIKYYIINKTIWFTYYNVSGGPIMSTSHWYMSLSSMRPAENPSTGFLFNSIEKKKRIWMKLFYITSYSKWALEILFVNDIYNIYFKYIF